MCWYCKRSNLQYFLYIVIFHFGRVFQKVHHCGCPVGLNGSSVGVGGSSGSSVSLLETTSSLLDPVPVSENISLGRVYHNNGYCTVYFVYLQIERIFHFGRVFGVRRCNAMFAGTVAFLSLRLAQWYIWEGLFSLC